MIVNVRNSSTFEEAKGGGLFHGFTKQILRRGVLANVRVVIEVKHIFIWLKKEVLHWINQLLTQSSHSCPVSCRSDSCDSLTDLLQLVLTRQCLIASTPDMVTSQNVNSQNTNFYYCIRISC